MQHGFILRAGERDEPFAESCAVLNELVCPSHVTAISGKRAVLANVALHKWARAATLASKYDRSQRYLQVVHSFRHRYLEAVGRTENNAQLQALFNEVSQNN